MAHPGLWGLAGLAAALVAAGIWLTSAGRAPETASTPNRTEEPRAAPAEPVTLAPPPGESVHPPSGSAASEQSDATPQGPAGPAPAPDAVVLPPKPGEPPPPAPQPALAPRTEPDAEPSVEPADTTPDLPAIEVDRTEPDEAQTDADVGPIRQFTPGSLTTYAGATVIEEVQMGLLTRSERDSVMVAVNRSPVRPYFGAVAARVGGASFVSSAGHADIDAAENAALTACTHEGRVCALVARIVPEDWDGRRADTLSHAQALVWQQAVAAASGSGEPVLFGWTRDGVATFASAEDPFRAAGLVATACAQEAARLGLRATPCDLAWVQPDLRITEPDAEPASVAPALSGPATVDPPGVEAGAE